MGVLGAKCWSNRSGKGQVWWKKFQQIKERIPLLRPKPHLPYGALPALAPNAVNQLLKSAVRNTARYVLWQSGTALWYGVSIPAAIDNYGVDS